MIEYRPFRNIDPPAIAEIWRSHPPQRALVQLMSPSVLERAILSKPYFDRYGFILAVDSKRPVGFVHAGFGPAEDQSTISTDIGIVCMLMVADHESRGEVQRELLARAEQYLRAHGATRILGGGVDQIAPFYLGLYGGCQLPGILKSDSESLEFFTSNDYAETGRRMVLERQMSGFRPVVDRNQMQLRRSYHIEATLDPPSPNWWQACTIGLTDRTRFSLYSRADSSLCGQLTLWDMEPLASSWGVHAMGLSELEIHPGEGAESRALFLVGEALRQLQSHGVTLVEVQLAPEQSERIRLFELLGFKSVDEGVVLRKEIAT